MEKSKWRVVCYVNQFFGQIGGEDMAHVGFSVKDCLLYTSRCV